MLQLMAQSTPNKKKMFIFLKSKIWLWKAHSVEKEEFSTTQNLREINFGVYWSSKTALNIEFIKFFAISEAVELQKWHL